MSNRPVNPAHLGFLDEIDGQEAMDWAATRSAATLSRVDRGSGGARQALTDRMRAALDTDARIPMPYRRGEYLYNFWRDAKNPKGIWRRTSLDEYAKEDPAWEVLINVDKLAADEQENWVWKGAHVRYPENDRALIRLSRGGADATVIREFDVEAKEFVTDEPFNLPEAKSDVSWVDKNTLLVGTDFGPHSVTDSGYPVEVVEWWRGTNVESDGEVLYRGEKSDVAVGGWCDTTPGWERIFISRAIDFYNSERFLRRDGELIKIDVPLDCGVSFYREWMLITPRADWQGVPAGALAAINAKEFLSGAHEFQVIFQPDSSSSLQGYNFTKNFLVLTILQNVSSYLEYLPLEDLQAQPTRIDAPALSSNQVVSTSPLLDDDLWLLSTNFTNPSTLWNCTLPQRPAPIKQALAFFDSSAMETRQHWATSADGTKIPYFITGNFTGKPQPTLVYAYGGFEVSLPPSYSAMFGIGLLELGALVVQANLRGGDEFGPEWHSQVVKENRFKVWEDHRAVIEDLHKRGYTTPQLTAIRGGSNGGLLTAGALVKYPELLGAVISQVPLTDMFRYNTLSAGASWMAEYGDPDDPAIAELWKEWSPVHNVVKHSQRPYPPALVTTSTRDDRVHPAHARQFANALEQAGQPVDYWENTEGGHAGAADNEQTARFEGLAATWLWEKWNSRVD